MSDVAGAKRGRKDAYSNIAFGSVTMSAANTQTFSQINVAVGMFQGVALLIHRVLWYPLTATIRELVAATDSLYMALTCTNRVTAINDATDPSIICMQWIVGVGANVANEKMPLISDFSSLPSGGKLVPANPLWIAAHSGGFAAAGTVKAQLDFSFVQLTDADYLELLQSMYPITI